MKKFMSILLTLFLITGTSTAAFAAGNDTTGATLTAAQQQARNTYLQVHFNDMNELVTLRKLTQTAQDTNNADTKLIMDKLKAKTTLNKDSITNLKDLAGQKKSLALQAKKVEQQRLSLKSQYNNSVTAKDVNKMKIFEKQILDLNKQISDIKIKSDVLKAKITPLQSQIKSARDVNKDLKVGVKNQIQSVKTIHETIKTQEKEKAQLWITYEENIKNKDYATAGITFKEIIAKKSAILNNINKRSTLLKTILTSLN